MRLTHFHAFRPICPRCRAANGQENPLVLANVITEHDDVIYEGILHCPDSNCQLEYPIIDGIPLLFPDVRSYISDNHSHLIARDDLSETTESILGDCIGPGTLFDSTRQHLSTYAWDNYGDLDVDEPGPETAAGASPGAVIRCLEKGLELLGGRISAPVIDLGCSVGRSTFELAARGDCLTLGIDNNFSMLRLAQNALQNRMVRYPRRRVGVVYDRREFTVNFNHSDKADFWACDALSLPFSSNNFGLAVGLHILDSVASPRTLLESISHLLEPGGSVILACPYDWSPAVTPLEGWIGGHSQRGGHRGAGEPLLRSLLTPGAHAQSVNGLRLVNELEAFPWHTRIQERSTMSYQVHIVTAEAYAA